MVNLHRPTQFWEGSPPESVTAAKQRLTLVHCLAQLKHILWHRVAFRGCFGSV